VVRRICLGLAGMAAVLAAAGLALGLEWLANRAGVATTILVAVGLGGVRALAGYQYTAWIVAAVVAAMVWPRSFEEWGGVRLRDPWVVLVVVQTVMFGMGTQMRLADFFGVARQPRGVVVGLACQFTIMPLLGWALSQVVEFPPEVAAGIVLIGSCSSGLASNVMTYLAGANLALSVTVTAMATMLAPVVTPLWMKLLAGRLIEVSMATMTMEIVKIVLVPVGAALLSDGVARAPAWGRTIGRAAAVVAAGWLAWLAAGGWDWIAARLRADSLQPTIVVSFIAAAVAVGVVWGEVRRRWPLVDRLMPYASMAGIIYFTAVTTAAGRDDLLRVGPILFAVAVAHNGLGYLLGYTFSRLLGLDVSSARAIALEVGLQNGGMATGIAGRMGKLGTVGLAAAVFSPWMNVSGSVLANWWARRPTDRSSPRDKP